MPLTSAEMRRKNTAVNSVLILFDPCIIRLDFKVHYLEM